MRRLASWERDDMNEIFHTIKRKVSRNLIAYNVWLTRLLLLNNGRVKPIPFRCVSSLFRTALNDMCHRYTCRMLKSSGRVIND